MICFIIGPSRSGKTRFIESLDNTWGKVEVGKIFRERYPLSHFKGEGAPAHTEAEALQIFEEELIKCKTKKRIAVSGQPRNVLQVQPILQLCRKYRHAYAAVLFTATDEVLMSRLTPEDDVDFYTRRIQNDKRQLYDVLCNLTAHGVQFFEPEDIIC